MKKREEDQSKLQPATSAEEPTVDITNSKLRPLQARIRKRRKKIPNDEDKVLPSTEEKSQISEEEKKYLSHLKEYWEMRSYQTIELDLKLVGHFSNQTREARWHDERVVIYMDAACSGNGTEDCKAAYAIFLNNESPYNQQKCIEDKKQYLSSDILTNNQAEIIGVIEALKLAKQYNLNKVEIRMDSKWIVDYFRLFRG